MKYELLVSVSYPALMAAAPQADHWTQWYLLRAVDRLWWVLDGRRPFPRLSRVGSA